jgi:hypothetical protein
VSTGGGTRPHWSRSGHELFFVGADGALMKVDVGENPVLDQTDPVRVVAPGYFIGIMGGRLEGRHYDVSPDAQRFLMIKTQGDTAPASISVIERFDFELQKRTPAK